MRLHIGTCVVLCVITISVATQAQTTTTANLSAEAASPQKKPPQQQPAQQQDAQQPAQVHPPAPLQRDPLLERTLILLREQQILLAQRSSIAAQREATMPVWLLPLLTTAAVASLVAATLTPLLHWRTRLARAAVAKSIGAINTKLDSIRGVVEVIQGATTAFDKKLDSALQKSGADATGILAEINTLRDGIGKIVESLGEPSGGDAVRLERQVLAEHWKQFREKKELSDVQENPWDPLLAELPSFVPDELRPSLDAVLAPWREHRLLIQKIGIIPRVVNGEVALGSEAAELKRARELTQLLLAAQGPESNKLRFSLQTWITDTFLPFADLYLQSYQKALFEQRHAGLQQGMTIVHEILRLAALEPIEVTLGETPFDSTRHIGRFTSNDPHMPDGVIAAVVRNGFIESGRQVIRQPEVVVNRVR